MINQVRLAGILVLSCLVACSGASRRSPEAADSLSAGQYAATGIPSAEEMQSAFRKASTPTAEHDFLKQFAGKWTATSSWRMSPDVPAETSKAWSTNSMIYGGKFLKQEYKGTFNGQPFEGTGYVGYDTVAGEFTSIWIDSMTTTIMISTGTYNPITKSINFSGRMSCPLLKDKKEVRSVLRLVDANHHVFEMFDVTPKDGREFKSLEIAYVSPSVSHSKSKAKVHGKSKAKTHKK